LARQNGAFEVEVIDLGEIKLPVMDEPNHPLLKKYVHEHTKAWSATIDRADAFIFVTSEYNYSYPGRTSQCPGVFDTGVGVTRLRESSAMGAYRQARAERMR